MEIGTTVISTKEYMELRSMKDNLDARKAEIEANADKINLEEMKVLIGNISYRGYRFIGKDEALKAMQKTVNALAIEVQKNGPKKINSHPKTTLGNRLRFLFTGTLEYKTTGAK